jgi:glycerol-3-phosphate O-acyltransferase
VLAPARLREGIAAVGDLADRVVVDGPLDKLRACADRGTLIITPTHSSNMDSVVIGWAFDQAGLPPVTYGAGKNLFSNRFLSFFMHNLGAYRVDRRLRHELYKDVLKEYSTVLLEHGYHSLFFPGGTRSRSGAVERRLKLGLLGTALTAYQNHLRAGAPQRRLYVVPTTINYSIVLEAETLIDEFLAEEGKHRDIIEDDEFSSRSRRSDFPKHILSRPGALHIRFGEPLDVVGNATEADGDSIDPHGRRIDPAAYFTSLAPGGGLRGPAALIELLRDPIEARDRSFDLVGDVGHFASIGASGEATGPSSFAWFTPSARAI